MGQIRTGWKEAYQIITTKLVDLDMSDCLSVSRKLFQSFLDDQIMQ